MPHFFESSRHRAEDSESIPFIAISTLPDRYPDPDHPIWSFHERVIRTRGFWYPDETGFGGILSVRPDLKSCCIASPSAAGHRIVLRRYRLAGLPGRAVTVTGKFTVAPLYTQEGELAQLYLLEDLQ